MGKYSTPKRGSLQFIPKSRARSPVPRVHVWVPQKDRKVLGFAGYKVGMTRIIYVDSTPTSKLKGRERSVPVTIVEVPPVRVVGFRFYTGDPSTVVGESWSQQLPKELARRTTVNYKEKNVDELAKRSNEIRLIVCTTPSAAGFGKKIPEIMEMGLNGTTEQQLATAKELVGKDLQVTDVLKEGDLVDVFGITKGKGFQGSIKRHGVKLQDRKAKRSKRKPANMGGRTPHHVFWGLPTPGQMGYNQRVQLNKQILKIGKGLNPAGGWHRYGAVENYLMVAGSVQGPPKRLVRFRFAVRPREVVLPSITYIEGETQ